jgi:hypothetical protein
MFGEPTNGEAVYFGFPLLRRTENPVLQSSIEGPFKKNKKQTS